MKVNSFYCQLISRNLIPFCCSELGSVKRGVNYACAVLCANRECLQFLKTTEIEYLDTSPCLTLDKVNINIFNGID